MAIVYKGRKRRFIEGEHPRNPHSGEFIEKTGAHASWLTRIAMRTKSPNLGGGMIQASGGEGLRPTAGTTKASSLSAGSHARVQGVDSSGRPTKLDGYVQSVGPVTMRQGAKRTPMLAVQMAETPSGGGANWRGTVYVPRDATVERTHPKADLINRLSDRIVSDLMPTQPREKLDTPRAKSDDGGMAPITPAAGTMKIGNRDLTADQVIAYAKDKPAKFLEDYAKGKYPNVRSGNDKLTRDNLETAAARIKDGTWTPEQAAAQLEGWGKLQTTLGRTPYMFAATALRGELKPKREASDSVQVYDVQADAIREVSRADAAAGVQRFARSLGPGTPAAAVGERRALEIARGPGLSLADLRTESGKVPTASKVANAVNVLKSSKSRDEARAALDGMTVAQLKQVYEGLNRRRPTATRKADMVDRLIHTTVGNRINSQVLRGEGPNSWANDTVTARRAVEAEKLPSSVVERLADVAAKATFTPSGRLSTAQQDVIDLGTGFSGNPYSRLPKFEALDAEGWRGLSDEQIENAQFAMRKMSRNHQGTEAGQRANKVLMGIEQARGRAPAFTPKRDADPNSKEGFALALRQMPGASLRGTAAELESGDITPREAADRVSQFLRSLAGRTMSDIDRASLADLEKRMRAQDRADLGLDRPAPTPAAETYDTITKRATLLAMLRTRKLKAKRGAPDADLRKLLVDDDMRKASGAPAAPSDLQSVLAKMGDSDRNFVERVMAGEYRANTVQKQRAHIRAEAAGKIRRTDEEWRVRPTRENRDRLEAAKATAALFEEAAAKLTGKTAKKAAPTVATPTAPRESVDDAQTIESLASMKRPALLAVRRNTPGVRPLRRGASEREIAEEIVRARREGVETPSAPEVPTAPAPSTGRRTLAEVRAQRMADSAPPTDPNAPAKPTTPWVRDDRSSVPAGTFRRTVEVDGKQYQVSHMGVGYAMSVKDANGYHLGMANWDDWAGVARVVRKTGGQSNMTLAEEAAKQDPRGTFGKYARMTRAEFDALPEDARKTIIAELRRVAASGEQQSYTIPSNRTSMGTTVRGLQDADHVRGAREKMRELTYVAPPPIDNSIAGRAARLKAGDTSAVYGATIEQMQEAAREAGFWGPGNWKRPKVEKFILDQVRMGDRRPSNISTPEIAKAMRGADKTQALAILEAREATETGLTKTDMKAIAADLGVPLRNGDSYTMKNALAAAAKGAPGKAEAAPAVASATPVGGWHRASGALDPSTQQRTVEVDGKQYDVSGIGGNMEIRDRVDGRLLGKAPWEDWQRVADVVRSDKGPAPKQDFTADVAERVAELDARDVARATQAAAIAAKEAELEVAKRRFQAEADWRPSGGMRTKSFGVRADANLRRAGEASRDVERLEHELKVLRLQVRPQPPQATQADIAGLEPGDLVKLKNGLTYKVVKVNKSTVKVAVPPGMDDLMPKSKIVRTQKAGVTTPAAPSAPEVPTVPTPEPKRTAFDQLLDPASPDNVRIKNKSMIKLAEQMEAHGWKLTSQNGQVSLTDWEAPDGRTMRVQFITSDKPIIYTSNKYNAPTVTYKAATAHVVTPTAPEATSRPFVEQAMKNIGLTPIAAQYESGGYGRNDPWLSPLRDAQQDLHPVGSYGGRGRTAQETAANLRTAAEQYRDAAKRADALYGDVERAYGGGYRDSNSVRREELADQFDRIADELERMDAAHKASVAERERLAALPLDIRAPKVRGAAPKRRAPGKA